MSTKCGGAHEISGIKTPLFLCGGWLKGSWGGWVGGWVVIEWVMGWMGGGGVGHGVGGWMGGGGVSPGVGGWVLVGWVVFGWWVGGVVMLWVPMTPPSWGVSDDPHDTLMLFFGNLVKKLDNLSL